MIVLDCPIYRTMSLEFIDLYLSARGTEKSMVPKESSLPGVTLSNMVINAGRII